MSKLIIHSDKLFNYVNQRKQIKEETLKPILVKMAVTIISINLLDL